MLQRRATVSALGLRRGTAVSAGGPAEPAAYCRALVQKHDYESYLCSYFYPRERQAGYFALKAFFVELALVPDGAMGRMRLQFWRDAIKGPPPRHPVALALHEAAREATLQRYHLRRIVDAREADAQAEAEGAAASLLHLLLALVGVPDARGALAHAASHVGAAQGGVARLRRGVPADAYEDAAAAHAQLRTARAVFADAGAGARGAAMPVFVTAIPAAAYLARLERAGFDAGHRALRGRDWRLPWLLWRGYHRNVF